jgi:hypothetical protein
MQYHSAGTSFNVNHPWNLKFLGVICELCRHKKKMLKIQMLFKHSIIRKIPDHSNAVRVIICRNKWHSLKLKAQGMLLRHVVGQHT